MQDELEASHPGEVRLFAINEQGYGSLDLMAAQGDIPLLQDDPSAQVWTSWGATYRDVILLDADNQVVGVFNLTSQDLQQPAHYEALRDLLVDAIAP